MKVLQSDISTPLYQQICDILREQIESGVFKVGDKIPSEDNLCKMYNVSRVTVRNAIGHLVDDNILVKKHGKGTFVAGMAFVESPSANGSFTKSCLQMNAKPSTKLISRKLQKAGKTVAKHIGVEEGQKVICLKRLRLTNDIAVIFEVDYFTEDFEFMLHEDVEQIPMLDVIKKNIGKMGHKYLDTFEVRFATKEQAAWLNCPVNTPLLGVSQIVSGERHGILYYNEQFIRSDIYKYVVGS